MNPIRIHKGKNIKIKGAAAKQVEDAPIPEKVAIQPQDFRGLNARLSVKADDQVKVGSPLFEDKACPEIKIVSPASGKVAAINRGAKRALLDIVIDVDGSQEALEHQKFSETEIGKLSREAVVSHLLEGGVWPCIRQRPFSNVANPKDTPKSIFIQGMSTEPLSLDIDFILNDKEKEFQIGLDIIAKLTKGKVYLCCHEQASSKALTAAQNVEIQRFAGPHPTGNVSTFIHYLDPIHKSDVVWYLQAEDVLRVAALFLTGSFSPQRYVAVTGEGAHKRVYKKAIIGSSISHLLEGDTAAGMRCISGSILSGKNVGAGGYLCFYDSQITIIPEGGARHFLGWMMPGFNKYSFSKAYASSFSKQVNVSLDTDENGGHRAIVLNHLYDDYVTIDVMTYFLLRAVIGEDIEEAERLGILECDEEDFALCTFVCPSKTDVGGIIRGGLDLIEKEG